MAYAYKGEKKIIADLLVMYKNSPSLWDNTNPFYSNKVIRKNAYAALLEKYKEMEEDCTVLMLKKKIENMRATYRRERNKVIKSKMNGDEIIHKPKVWYYKYLTFLDRLEHTRGFPGNNSNIEFLDRTETIEATENIQNEEHEEIEMVEYEQESEPLSRPGSEPASEAESEHQEIVDVKCPAGVYITDNHHDYEYETPKYTRFIEKKSKSTEPKRNPIVKLNSGGSVSSLKNMIESEEATTSSSQNELFGRTVSAQLDDLQPQQRFIAQKLISDVIFFGRLDKLKTESRLLLDDN